MSLEKKKLMTRRSPAGSKKKKPKGARVGSPFMYDNSTGHGLGKLQSFHWRNNSEKGI
jgi:hypothetical protein